MKPLILTCGILALFGLLGTPAAEAASYRWTGASTANKNWTNPDNWVRLDAIGNGFPNGAGDEATFLGPFLVNVTVTIRDGETLTVGSIRVPDADSITVTAAGTGRLALETGSNAGAQLSVNTSGFLILNAPVLLRSQLLAHAAAGGVELLKTVSAAGATLGVRKTGGGYLLFGAANSYTGDTQVTEGRLQLQSLTGPSIAGDITIGDGLGAAQSAEVVLDRSDQIADAVRVAVNADGRLRMPNSDIIGDLVITDGLVTPEQGTLTMRRLTMTGGALFIPTGGFFRLEGNIVATSSARGPAQIRRAGAVGTLNLLDASRTLTVNDGPNAVDLELEIPFIGTGNVGVVKDGPGTLRFSGAASSTYLGATIVRGGRVELARVNNTSAVPGALTIEPLGGASAAVVMLRDQNIPASATVTVGANGQLVCGNHLNEIARLNVTAGGRVDIGDQTGDGAIITPTASILGGQVNLAGDSRLVLTSTLTASSAPGQSAVIAGAGSLLFNTADAVIETADGPQPIDLRVDARLRGTMNLSKTGAGVAQFGAANSYTGATRILGGTLLINGTQPTSAVTVANGVLGGFGAVGTVTANAGRVAPGTSPGRLVSGAVTFGPAMSFDVELNGTTMGVGYDQLAVTGAVNLGGATLSISVGPGFAPPKNTRFAILANDGVDPIVGTFAGRPEGSTIPVGTREFTLTYKGGDGNDIVLTAEDEAPPPTYFLAEGATGDFFDEDVLIANPNASAAPVTMTFFKEGGEQIVVERTLGPQSHTVVHVDEIPGLEAAVASVRIVSTSGQQLFVERSMFWDTRWYAGHTGSAIDQPSADWFFAEGAQGVFETFVLMINPNPAPADVTLTFLLEGESPVVKTVRVGAGSRETVRAGAFDELASRSFGITVHATQPIMAERSMYLGSLRDRLWSGGHESAGVSAASTQWYLAEGATGFFDTFILLGNPQPAPAEVTLRFLLTTGETIVVQKTVPANGRVTVNPAAESDTRLHNATLSTVVTSTLPIVAERSMYWAGANPPWGEAHNSFGVVEAATSWGLAEGRLGGARAPFSTYILLANPQATAAQVRVTFLRESAPPLVRDYTVPATGRFTIDVSTIDELRDSLFGASIVSTNHVPIVVERSMYWDAAGVHWSGGTNATGIAVR